MKEWIDRSAIDLAAKSLASGASRPAYIPRAVELLNQSDFLKPAEEIAKLVEEKAAAFTFPSNVTTAAERNDTVHGRLFRAKNPWATRPFVILVHGWNAELHYLHILPRLARALNKRGCNAALIELPYHLQRRPKPASGMNDFISDDLPGMLLATKQAIADIHSLGLWAKAQGCPHVAVWGFSLGAWLAGHYICQSGLPSAAVLTTPVSDLARAVRELGFCHPIRAGLSGASIDLGPLNLQQRRPRVSPEAIQVVQSSYDLFVPGETYRELAQAWNLGAPREEPQGHISILLARGAMNRSIRWLAQRLAIPPPD